MSHTDLRVVQSAVRCPWCHEDIEIASDDWVACRGCMARHHDACWAERARCATCGGAARLGGAVLQVPSAEVERLRAEAELAKLEREVDRAAVAAFGRLPAGRPISAWYLTATVALVFFGLFCGAGLLHLEKGFDKGALGLQALIVVVGGFLTALARESFGAYDVARDRLEARRAELLSKERSTPPKVSSRVPDIDG